MRKAPASRAVRDQSRVERDVSLADDPDERERQRDLNRIKDQPEHTEDLNAAEHGKEKSRARFVIQGSR